MNTFTRPSKAVFRCPPRCGEAAVEFVLALPFLLLLIVFLTWLGFTMIYQAEVDVTARHKAWQKRYDNPSAEAFVFTTHPGYKAQEDFVGGEAEKPVQLFSLLDDAPKPTAAQIIMAGSWDHRNLPLDELPNWQAYTQAIINAKTGDLQNLLGGINNFRNIVGDIGANLLSSQLGQLGGMLGAANSASSSQQTTQNQEQQDRIREKLQLQTRAAELKAEIIDLEGTNPLRPKKMTSAEQRKLFRLKSELSDVEIYLRELR